MSLVASLNVGVSALRSFSEGIQVISNNIANVSTVAYKSSHANYSDTFSNLLRPLVPNEKGDIGAKIDPTQIGGGVQVQSVTASFGQGTISNTSSTSDLAIAGPGYFRVKDPVSGVSYVTRAGNFRFDANGYLVTQQGYRVQGTNGASTQVAYNASTGDYDVKNSSANPVTRLAVRASANPGILQGVDTTGLAVGMVVYSSTQLKPFTATVTKGSSTVTVNMASSDLGKIQVGQPFNGPGISANTYITNVTGSTLTLSQAADLTSQSTDTFTIPQWSNNLAASGARAHATITAINGSTVTLSNMDGVQVYDQPLSFTFITPRTTKLSVNSLSAVQIPAGTTPPTVTVAAPYNLTGITSGSKTVTISSTDAANLKVGMAITTTGVTTPGGVLSFPANTTIVGIGAGATGFQTLTLSNPAGTGAAATDTITAAAYPTAPAGTTFAYDYSLSAVASGTNTATVADATNLKVGMTVTTSSFPAGTRITAITPGAGTTATLTFSNSATATPAGGADAITAASRRLYSVNVSDSNAVADGMVAKLTDPVTGKVIYAGVNVDRSSAVPQILLDFSAFGDGVTDPSSGTNPDPISADFNNSTASGAFSVDFETNTNAVQYTDASSIGDVRIAFDENKDFKLVDQNGGTLSNNWLAKAQLGEPKLKSFTVGTGGGIIATLSNGQTFKTGQVLLQSFLDPGALVREGDNLFSGMDLAGETNAVKWNNMTIDKIDQVSAGKSGLGAIQGSALELSNVDIGQEFSEMITTQRSFQAGSRVITVTDQMLEEVVNLKR